MNLFGSLNIDVKESDKLFLFEINNLCFLRTIHVGMHVAVFDEFISVNFGLESCMVHKMIVHTIYFSFTRGSSSVGNTETEAVSVFLENFIHQCTLKVSYLYYFTLPAPEGPTMAKGLKRVFEDERCCLKISYILAPLALLEAQMASLTLIINFIFSLSLVTSSPIAHSVIPDSNGSDSCVNTLSLLTA